MLVNVLALVLLTGLTSASLLLCAAKWGWLEIWELYGPRWFKRCDFCLGFWSSVALLAALLSQSEYAGWWVLLALPLALPAASLARAVYGVCVR